eukprot:1924620-Heterocapsa_arctica.AAC.1
MNLTVKSVNKIMGDAKTLVAAGEDRLHFRCLNIGETMTVALFDANYAQEPGGESQAGFTLATDDRMLSGYSRAVLVEHSSSRIRRVARSTMAAESASLSMAIDQALR